MSELFLQRRGIAMNHHQDVVEIMDDSGGELLRCLHFLVMAQLGLQFHLVGDVLQDQQPMRTGIQFKRFDREQYLALLSRKRA